LLDECGFGLRVSDAPMLLIHNNDKSNVVHKSANDVFHYNKRSHSYINILNSN
jgi:hypothetical protein